MVKTGFSKVELYQCVKSKILMLIRVLKRMIHLLYNTNNKNRGVVNQMSIEDFQILTKLGEGAYSSVYKVKRLVDQAVYALKKVKLVNLSTRQIHNAVNQVRILASIRHPNVICYKEAFYDTPSQSLCIVMEYADGGDLLQKIFDHKQRNQFFTEQYIWQIFTQVLKGLKALHDLKILHRDIKSANVFLSKGGVAKLGDMNVSKVQRKDAMCETQTGTPYYASPQVWQDDLYDSKSDIWSLGCVLYEFIALKPPFRARDMQGLYRKVARGYYTRIDKQYSQDLVHVLQMLIKVKPAERLSCGELLDDFTVRKHLKRIRDIEVQEKSVLLKTIKISKNINYLTQRLPKANYSPLKYRSLSKNHSSMERPNKRYGSNIYNRNPSDLQLSLPPIHHTKKAPVLKASLIIPRKKSKDSIVSQQSKKNLSKVNAVKNKLNKSKDSLPKLKGKSLERSTKN